MKKLIITAFLFSVMNLIYAQEALKSIEEDYYDFLGLTGVTERPALGYRTLSDNEWNFNEITDFLENEDGTFSKVKVPGFESDNNLWKDNNIGKKQILWSPSSTSENFILRGLNQNLSYKFYGPELFGSFNSNVPYGQNDGALWQGVGLNTSLTIGARLEFYGLEVTFKPQICWNQNRNYDYITGIYGSPYSYNWEGGIDLVQRYGNTSFFTFDWGDSEIRYTWYNLTFGFGTQNAWLGPSYLNPMLGSNNAPGYPKFDIGLRKTDVIIPLPKSKSLNLGQIEGRIWTGMLKESEYFDDNPSNDKRMLNAISMSYAPSFIPGFTIGLNRIFMTSWKMENLKYILRLFTAKRENGYYGGAENEDQKLSFFAEWSFPKIGFTVYGEFGRDDFSYDEKSNPFHTAIYTLGVKQYIPLPFNLKSELILEWNNFEMSQDFQMQWTYMGYYVHGAITQGYTNNGQIIGAGSGYFGNSQFIQYKIYYPKGYTLLKFHRHNPNTNSVYSKSVYTSADINSDFYLFWYHNFETYYTLGIESGLFCTKDLLTTLGLNFSKIYHRNYTSSSSHNFDVYFFVKYEL